MIKPNDHCICHIPKAYGQYLNNQALMQIKPKYSRFNIQVHLTPFFNSLRAFKFNREVGRIWPTIWYWYRENPNILIKASLWGYSL